MTFYTKDIDTLQAHATHRETVTDLVQEAIKDLIAKRGWGDPEPGRPEDREEAPMFKVTLEPEPEAKDKATEANDQEDSPLPDWLTAAKRGRPPG